MAELRGSIHIDLDYPLRISHIAYRILDYKLYNLNTPSNGGQGIVNSFSPPQPSPCRSIFPDQAFPGGGR